MPKAFTASDFQFNDAHDNPANALAAVIIDTLPQNGTLTLSGADVSQGQTILATDIANLLYTPNSLFSGTDSLTFDVRDDGGTVNGGVDTSSNAATLTIGVGAVDQPPTATNLSASESYTEDTPLNLTDIVVRDVDSANVTATLTLSSAAAGALSTGTSGAVTSTYNAGTGVWTASGAIADVNALLAGRDLQSGGELQRQLHDRDQRQRRRRCRSAARKSMTGTAVNDAPTATNLSAAGDLHRGHAAEPDRHRGERRRQRQRDGDADAVECGGGQPEHRHLGRGDLDLRRHRGVDRRRARSPTSTRCWPGVTFTPAANFNGSFTIATSVSDGVAGGHRQQGDDRHRGERCADGDQPVGGRRPTPRTRR